MLSRYIPHVIKQNKIHDLGMLKYASNYEVQHVSTVYLYIWRNYDKIGQVSYHNLT